LAIKQLSTYKLEPIGGQRSAGYQRLRKLETTPPSLLFLRREVGVVAGRHAGEHEILRGSAILEVFQREYPEDQQAACELDVNWIISELILNVQIGLEGSFDREKSKPEVQAWMNDGWQMPDSLTLPFNNDGVNGGEMQDGLC